MGSCVSRHSDSARLPSLQSKNAKLIVPSPAKLNAVTINGQDHSTAGYALKSQRSLPRSRDHGNKDEAFFDSQPWLESDCEDDFLSVNGDFTPSRGSTPVHHNFSSTAEPSPKKRLSSLRHHQDGEASDEYVVIENDARTTNAKEDKSAQCCLPGLRLSRRKKKTTLPNGIS